MTMTADEVVKQLAAQRDLWHAQSKKWGELVDAHVTGQHVF